MSAAPPAPGPGDTSPASPAPDPGGGGGPLLTVAVPTYNRAAFLAECLGQLVGQLPGLEDRVELLVSDNASSDGTAEVVAAFAARAPSLRSLRNPANLGADENLIRCLEQARGTFVLVLGDDDVLLDGALPWLVELLAREPCATAFLRPSPFERDFRREIPPVDAARTWQVHDDPGRFLRRINVDATFISSNVVNKARLPAWLDLRRFSGTHLNQLSWILPAILGGDRFLYVDRALVGGRVNNSTGFDFFQVFGVNYLAILDALRGSGLDAATHAALVEQVLTEFYPRRIHSIRSGRERYDGGRGPFEVLRPAFGRFPLFWLFVVPAIVLPVPLVRPSRRLATFLLACWRLLARPFR